MRLIKLILHKYKRLRLNLINTIEFSPSAPTQFIVGTNGAGKSSFISECSPLPPDKNEYDTGGYKEQIYEKSDKTYHLKSHDVDGVWEHSFIVDGKELNEGHTISVQLALVKSHFNYTYDMHALVTGEVSFTRMSPSDRRKWFTFLADANYDFAIGVFKRVTERYNESRHALKRAKERLVIETSKLLPAQELETLRDQCSDMYVHVQRLIEKRQPLLNPSQSYLDDSNKLVRSLKDAYASLQTLLKKVRKGASAKGFSMNRDDVSQEIFNLHQAFQSTTTRANQLFEDHQRVQKLWDAMQVSKLENAANIQQVLNNLDQEIEQSQKACSMQLDQTADAATTIASCDKILAWWPEVQEGFHDNSERGWGRAFLENLNQEVDKARTALVQAQQLVARHEQVVEHHQSHQSEDSVTCPKCMHQFQPNFSAHTLKEAQDKLARYRRLQDEAQRILEEKLELLDKVQTYLRHYTMVVRQLRNYPGLESFASWIAQEHILVNTPGTFINHVTRFRDQAGHWNKIELATKKKQEVQKLSTELLSRDHGTENIQADRERLEKLIGDVEFEKAQTQTRLNELQQHQYTLNELHKQSSLIQDSLNKVKLLHETSVDSLKREVYAQMLREHQQQLHMKDQALMAAERQQSVIEHIEGEIIELTQDTQDFKILQQELSPTEGLIAEGIFGFMRSMVEQMNKTVSMLFSYPLTIKPCSTDSGNLNLNYKFPIVVDKEPRSDVSKGSSGMRELFDLSFVIAAMKAAGMGEYPLFLDEFGKGFDPVHKQATVSLLLSLMELEKFEQIFLITHSVTQFGAIGRSEVMVLHEANVTLPPHIAYNKHVKIS